MACCNFKKRMADKNGNCPPLIKSLATHLSKISKIDVQIFHSTKAGFGKVFDYAEVKEGRSNVTETIKFQEHESKPILRNSKRRKRKSTNSKSEDKS